MGCNGLSNTDKESNKSAAYKKNSVYKNSVKIPLYIENSYKKRQQSD